MRRRKFNAIYIICILSALLSAGFSASAASGTISADVVSVKPGRTADVAVRIGNNPGVAALLLNIDYDPSVLTLTGVDNGEVFADDTTIFGKDTAKVPYTLIWEDGLSAENHTADGVLATLHFAVNPDAPEGDCAITPEIDEGSTFDVDLNKVVFRIQSGCVRVEHAPDSPRTAILISGGAVAAVAGFTVAGTLFVRKKRKDAQTDCVSAD
ncbi:MAG: hypothetical protein IJT44_07645 [Clostridia bacterium]|nr:hypothetical protein [Clostridia bacterium]